MVSLGLLTSSAVLVHLWDGQIEAHFHFFVMVTILACYEEWFPYLLASATSCCTTARSASSTSGSVYNHGDAVAGPVEVGRRSTAASSSRCASPTSSPGA